MELTTAAAALAVGTTVDLLGVGDGIILAVVGVANPVGVAAPAGELAGFVAVGLGVVAVTVGDAWSPEGAVGCVEGCVLVLDVG